ncbi:hypothetical protein BDV18DRAFT_54167 [Aspergillus unguis]
MRRGLALVPDTRDRIRGSKGVAEAVVTITKGLNLEPRKNKIEQTRPEERNAADRRGSDDSKSLRGLSSQDWRDSKAHCSSSEIFPAFPSRLLMSINKTALTASSSHLLFLLEPVLGSQVTNHSRPSHCNSPSSVSPSIPSPTIAFSLADLL